MLGVMPDFRPAEEHGPISEIFPDVFMVTGRIRMGPGLTITRNMFIVRQGDELVLVSSMRLSPEGEAELDKLGKVKHVVRIGGNHGVDDAYVLDRYAATFWSVANTPSVPKTDQTLAPGSSPIADGEPFVFEHAKRPEAMILLGREGGILLTADAYQHWTSTDGCSLMARMMLPLLGFGPTIIGGPWLKQQGLGVRRDFERLVERDFKHLMPGHGAALKDVAKEGLATAMSKRFR
jgi:hypothetical protein